MPSALIGHTGFVGGNLAAQHKFDACYNSKNIEDIAGQAFDLVVVSAMPAAMWIANRDPDADRAILDRLIGCLSKVRANQVVIMSTVAVYSNPIRVDEDSPIVQDTQTPYGRHRFLLEQFAVNSFPRALSIRLPGLFGHGLKKNAIYDLLHDHEVLKINSSAIYQFYNLDRIWKDLSTALNANLELVNFATEPLTVRELAQGAFEQDFRNELQTPAAHFDMCSKHAALFGGRNGYLYDKPGVLSDLRAFVQRERARKGGE